MAHEMRTSRVPLWLERLMAKIDSIARRIGTRVKDFLNSERFLYYELERKHQGTSPVQFGFPYGLSPSCRFPISPTFSISSLNTVALQYNKASADSK